MKYSFIDFNRRYLKDVIDDLKHEYSLMIKRKAMMFNDDLSVKVHPVERKNPETGGYEEYDYPLAYDIEVLYHFALGNIGIASDVEVSLQNVLRAIWWNPFAYRGDNEDPDSYDVRWKGWKENTRLGFLCYYVQAKIKLYQGSNLQALEVAVLSDYTNQHICTLLRQGEITGKHTSTVWIVDNAEARAYILEKQGDQYPDL